MVDTAAAASGLLGSLVGAAAAIFAQIVTQSGIADRDAEQRQRRENRTRALFAAYVEDAATTVAFTATGSFWETDPVITSLEPFNALANDPEMCLALDVNQIRATSVARATMKVCLQTATARKAFYDRSLLSVDSGQANADHDDSLRKALAAAYSVGFDALNACLKELGGKPIAANRVDEWSVAPSHGATPAPQS